MERKRKQPMHRDRRLEVGPHGVTGPGEKVQVKTVG